MTKIVTIRAQQKWEFRLESRKTETTLLKELNDLGQQGWELVDVMYYKDIKGIMTWTGFLKRPSIPQPQKETDQASNIPKAEPLEGDQPTPGQPKGFDLSGEEFQLKE